MRLILREDIDSLGRLGDEVDVKPGYGRNYLLPQGKAMLATEANLRAFETERRKLQKKMDAIRFAAEELAEKINSAEVVIPVRVGENDKLYGSVTSAHIADALEEKGIDIDKRKIVLEDPIRALGEYELEIKLHPDVKATLRIQVVRHGSESEQEES
ncbi:MAG: 50S ribosomal protein L9 [Desulfonatronovibrionaceae bacterium]